MPNVDPGTDEIGAHELLLFADNTEWLYRRYATPIAENLRKHYEAGRYDADKARRLWFVWATRAAKAYCVEFGDVAEWMTLFPASTRRRVAELKEPLALDTIREDIEHERRASTKSGETCHGCGHAINLLGMCMAPLSVAD